MNKDKIKGIKDIGLYFPKCAVKVSELALARGESVEKMHKGLKLNEFRISLPIEDSVTMGASALQNALQHSSVHISQIKRLVVATESSVDHAKPVATFIHGLLGLSDDCEAFDVKFACLAGSYALLDTIRFLQNQPEDVSAAVIFSDICRYKKNSSAEFTQGAGAIALILGANPEIIAIDHSITGTYTSSEADFFRPLGTPYAVVDGHGSINNYLLSLKSIVRYFDKIKLGLKRKKDYIPDAFIFHAPYPSLPLKALRYFVENSGEPSLSQRYLELKELTDYSTNACKRVGNIYTGSLFLSFVSLIDSLVGRKVDTVDMKIGFFSFGSGSGSKFFVGKVMENALKKIGSINLTALLNNRVLINVKEYESVYHNFEIPDNLKFIKESLLFSLTSFTDNGYPIYEMKKIGNQSKSVIKLR